MRTSGFGKAPKSLNTKPTKRPRLETNKENDSFVDEVQTIHLKQFTISRPRLNFGRVMLGDERVVELTIDNPTVKIQEIGVERLPTQDGFTSKDISYRVPPLTSDFKIPITWRPTRHDKMATSMVLTWDKMKYTIPMTGECPLGETSILNSSISGSNRMRAQQTDTNVIVKQLLPSLPETPITNKFDASSFKTPISKKPHITAKLSTIAKPTKMVEKRTLVTETPRNSRANLSKSSIQNSLINAVEAEELAKERLEKQEQLKLEQIAKRQAQIAERKRIKDAVIKKRKDFEAALEPLKRDFLVSEVAHLSSTRKVLRPNQVVPPQSINSGYSDDRIAYLLHWVQLVCALYDEEDLIETLGQASLPKVDCFGSPTFRKEPELVYQLVTNQYRSPKPLPLVVLFAARLEERRQKEEAEARMGLHCINYNDRSSAFVVTLSPVKETTETHIEFDEQEIIKSLSTLFLKLYEIRQKYAAKDLIIKLQNRIRGVLIRKDFVNKREAAITLQALLRGHAQRKKEANAQSNITACQALIRGYMQRCEYELDVQDVIKCQALVRTRLAVTDYEYTRFRVIKAQAFVRRFIAMQQHKHDIAYVIKCQSLVRRYLASKVFEQLQIQDQKKRTLAAIIKCQSHVRRFLAQKELIALQEEKHLLRCVVKLQSVFRMALAKNELRELHYEQHVLNCVVKLQSVFRMGLAKLELEGLREEKLELQSAIKIQSIFRMALARNILLALQYSQHKLACAVKIQSIFRMALAKRELRYLQEEKRTFDGIVKLQSVFRMVLARKELQARQYKKRLLNSVVKIQSVFRMGLAKLELEGLREEKLELHSAIKIQSIFRMALAQRQAAARRETLNNVIKCQSLVRSWLARRELKRLQWMQQKRNRAILIRKITTIQAIVRGYQSRCYDDDEKYFITKCQSVVRMAAARQEFLATRSKVVSLQALIRGHLQRCDHEYDVFMVTKCQATVRAVIARQNYLEDYGRVVKCQSTVRRFLAMKECDRQAQQIVKCQALVRGYLACLYVDYELFRITKCQAIARMLMDRSNYQYERSLIISMQARARGNIQREIYRDTVDKIILAQSCIRRFLAQTSYNKKPNARMQQASAVSIQRVFRGYLVRKRNIAQVTKIRERIASLATTVEERQQLAYRTRKALEILLTSKKMTLIMNACANLAVTTRFSSKCCENMVQQQAVPILFSVIRGCNRSKPHMQLLQHSLDILLHLARTRYTSHAVFSADCLDLLVEQLQMYRDQEDIFMRAMALMNLMAKHHRNILKTELGKNGGALFKRMKGIATVMERKYQIEKKYLQSCNLMNASKINSSKMDTSRMNVSTTQSARIANSNSVVLCYESIARFLIDISKN